MALYSQVPYVQSQIARNLQGGLASLGNRPLDEAKFNLEKVKTESGLARQAAADQRAEELFQLQKPGMEVQSMAAQNQLEQAKAPVRLTDFMTDMNTAEHMLWTPQDNYMGKNAPKETRDPAITKLAQMYGASWDVDPNSPTRGQMIRPDGTVVTKLDINRDAAPLKAFMVANSGMEHTMRSAKEKLLRSYQKGQINEAQYSQGVNQIAKFESSLPMQMKYAQQQIDFLSRFTNAGNPLFQSEVSDGLKRWQKKYDTLEESLAKTQAADLEFERKKEIENLKRSPKEGDSTGPYKSNGREVFEVYKNGKWEKYSTDIAEWNKKTNKDKSYEEAKDKLIDDTTSHYKFLMSGMLNEMGYIKAGPKDDPQKYEREHRIMTKRMEEDKKLIGEGKLPTWYTREKQPLAPAVKQAIAEEVLRGVDVNMLTNEERKKLREKMAKMAEEFNFKPMPVE